MRVNLLTSSVPPVIAAILLACVCTGCGGGAETQSALNPPVAAGQDMTASPAAVGWPAGLPADQLQPWERLNADGYAVDGNRRPSAVNAGSEFLSGSERFIEAGDVSDLGAASRLRSSTAGSGAVSWAQYRFVLGGERPGLLSTDVNLRRRSDGAISTYWLGLSNFATDSWEWRGSFAENHVRLELSEDAYRSPLGNMFVCVVACDGAEFDLVGLGASLSDPVDSSPPPVPAGLTAVPVAGGLELNWNPVIAADLAGYRVYHRNGWFLDQQATGIMTAQSLEGQARCILHGLSRTTFVRIAALDISGNASELSEIVYATPLPGAPPQLEITTDQVNGPRGLIATLNASGADSYDWDVDGDGIFDITGDTTGTAQADTDSTGLIRPAVRGTSSGGCVACGSVSLIIGGNIPPVANGFADPSFGPAPLEVTFSGEGTDSDGTIAMYSWDFDGNGIYEWSDAASGDPPPVTYNMPYLRNAKFRVDDDQGAFDVDTVSVLITESDDWHTQTIDGGEPITPERIMLDLVGGLPACTYGTANGQVTYTRSKDTDGRTWSFPHRMFSGYQPCLRVVNGSPAFCFYDSSTATCNFVRASDALGDVWSNPPVNAITVGSGGIGACMRIVNGRPAIACRHVSNNIIYVRASDVDGTAWPAGFITVGVGGVGQPVSLAIINGYPAVAWTDTTIDNKLMYARADNVNGTVFNAPVTVDDSTPATGLYPTLAEVNGRPAIVYSNTDNIEVRYVRAQDTTGTAWETPVRVNPLGANGYYGSLAVIDGMPTITYMNVDTDDLMISRANDASGTSWGDPELICEEGSVGRSSCLIENNGRPAVAYQNFTWSSVEFAYRKRDY